MINFIFSFIDHFGYLAIAFLIAIENIFPPIPSEVILSFGGFMTHKTQLTILGLIIASTIGSLIGALVLYWIGSLLTEKRLKQLFQHHLFKKLGFKADDVGHSIKWFEKYGVKAIFFGRFIPVIRSLISIPAGIAKVKLSQFVILTSLGSLIWNAVLLYLGSYMGSQWKKIVLIFEEYSLITAILIILALIYGAIIWYKKRLKK